MFAAAIRPAVAAFSIRILAARRVAAINILVAGGAVGWAASSAGGEQEVVAGDSNGRTGVDLGTQVEILSKSEWQQVDTAVERGLAWLATQQGRNGGFGRGGRHESAVTALATMAFLSRGHLPGEGKYGRLIDAAVAHVLECQQQSGQISSAPSDTHSTYHHAIAGVMLGEIYGMTDERTSAKIATATRKALRWAEQLQLEGRTGRRVDVGGWRYTQRVLECTSDLSVTSWMIMFYRSAQNAQFDVSEDSLNQAMEFVQRCYDPRNGSFLYCPPPSSRRCNWAMCGAGILTLSLAGRHGDPMAESAARWLENNPFGRYREIFQPHDRFHYASYYCTQAMFQIGGERWRRFYKDMAAKILAGQRRDGRWPSEAGENAPVASAYTTSIGVLTLTVPYQLLPVYQR